MNIIYRVLAFCILLPVANSLYAQEIITAKDSTGTVDSSKVFIRSINISGNKKTKSYIILREMQFHAGDSLRKDKVTVNFLQARNQIYNINLFTEVKIDSVADLEGSLSVNVSVREKWYIYPTPQFQLADRSFNEWIKVYHADLNRVIYGVKFAHYNFSGRRDQLRFYLLNGYARNISVSYNNPYSNKSLDQGYSVGTGFTQTREIAYATSYNNHQLLYRRAGFARTSFTAGGGISKRNGLFKSHGFSANITYVNVADSIVTKYNPTYFNNGSSHSTLPAFGYNFRFSNTNNNNYPLSGQRYSLGISKTGLGLTGGLNSFTVVGDISKYISHGKNFYSALGFTGFVRLPFDQAYINRRAMGFGGFYLRGLEDYVIDGVAATLVNYTLKKKIVAFDIPVPFHIRSLPKIPIKIFAKTYADAGYSYIPAPFISRLNNKFLYSGGFGLDILTLYDINIRFEYSFNQLGQKGLFLHGRSSF